MNAGSISFKLERNGFFCRIWLVWVLLLLAGPSANAQCYPQQTFKLLAADALRVMSLVKSQSVET